MAGGEEGKGKVKHWLGDRLMMQCIISMKKCGAAVLSVKQQHWSVTKMWLHGYNDKSPLCSTAVVHLCMFEMNVFWSGDRWLLHNSCKIDVQKQIKAIIINTRFIDFPWSEKKSFYNEIKTPNCLIDTLWSAHKRSHDVG